MTFLIGVVMWAASGRADEIRFTRALRVHDRPYAMKSWGPHVFTHVYLTTEDGRRSARAWCGWTWNLDFSLLLEISRTPMFDGDDVEPYVVLKATDTTHCAGELRRLDAVSAVRPLVIRDGRLASEF